MTERLGDPVRERADRILDAAGELLVRHGYRKVTVDDIAARARIGKGTVYLHWRTKHELFEALFVREAIGYVEDLVEGLRDDPARVRPHRLLAESFLIVHRRPVLLSLFEGDLTQLQGRLADSSLRSQELLAFDRFFGLMLDGGLLRRDVPDLPYAVAAVNAGYYLVDTVASVPEVPDVEAKAAALAHVVRHAFEPAEPPSDRDLAMVATRLVALCDGLLPAYRESVYGYRRGRKEDLG